MNTQITTPAALNLTAEVFEARNADNSNFLAEQAESVDVIVACCCCCCGVEEGVQTESAN